MTISDMFTQCQPQLLIVQHLPLGGKDRTILAAKSLGNFRTIAFDFLTNSHNRPIKTLDFFLHYIARNETAGKSKSLGINDERFANSHSWRNGKPFM